MSWYSATSYGCADPHRLLRMKPADQIAALSSRESPPTTAKQALALIHQHIASGSMIALHGCANPCPRAELGCKGFIGRCGGYGGTK